MTRPPKKRQTPVKGMQEPDRSPKPLHLLFQRSLLKEIHEFRFRHTLNTRSQTIMVLIRMGLEAEKSGHVPPKTENY